jgi:thymidine kinase
MVENLPERVIEGNPGVGTIEVICGCMFCGKTDELIRRLQRVKIALKSFVKNGIVDASVKDEYVQVFKASIDTRYSQNNVDSHCGTSIDAIPINKDRPAEIYNYVTENTRVVGVDEAQFFSTDIIEICHDLAHRGIRVIVAGLDTNFRGETYGSMGDLIAQAGQIHKLQAVCVVCGDPHATYTQRLVDGIPAHYNDPEENTIV